MQDDMEEQLKAFVAESYLFGDVDRMPAADDSLLETGVLDSTGVLELIEFLEMQFGITVEDSETVPDNLGSLAAIGRYVTSKQGGSRDPS